MVLSADALIGRTIDPTVFVVGIGQPALQLGEARLYKWGVSADYAITQHIHVNAGLESIGFEYGASPVIAGINEPYSRTHDVTARVGVGFAWGGRDLITPLK